MAKYLLHGNYVGSGIKGLQKEGGSSRRDAIGKLLSSLGGKVEAVYYALGDTDVYVIADLPDNVTAVAASMAVNASGAATIKTTALMTPEEMDQATKKVPAYRAPGQ
jgi:uncharacterized protein with GYD domain